MAKFLGSNLLFISCVTWVRLINGQSECNEPARYTDFPACGIRLSTLLHDNNTYFFGTNYTARCPTTQTIDCFTYVPPPPFSIIARMTGSDQQMQTANLDRWLDVKYTSPPGNYTGCDFFYEDTETTSFHLNPLVDVNRAPWLTRMQPEFTWDTSKDSNNQLYTLLFQDVGYGVTHTLWMNIQGNDFSTATVIPEYQGPGNPREIPNVYIYFLFKQNQRIESLSQFWENVITDYSDPAYLQLHWLEFMADNGLSGPVATNWMTITGDPMAAQNLVNFGIEMNCAFYVDRELQKLKSTRSFLPPSFDLSVFMRVNYDSMTLVLDICCSSTQYKGENVYVDPIGSALIAPATTRAVGSTLTVSLHKNKRRPDATTDFQGEYHTLVMVDPDVPSTLSSFGSNERPVVHWLVINARNGVISTGTEILTYIQPRPPNKEPHTYYFLLYKQMTNSVLNTVNVNDYTIGCERCQFALGSFTSDHKLSLVGASWMRVQNDLYVNYTNAIEDQPLNETVLCENVPGYANPCPANKGSTSYQNGVFILLILLTMNLARMGV